MRKDMDKVVTERPRGGHGNPSKKTGKRLSKDEISAEDHGSNRHPISRKRQFGYGAKEFSDLISPLRRYLRKQVGKPWNKVYSDLCKTLNKQTLSGQHILDHVKWEVEQNVKMVNGVPWTAATRFGSISKIQGLYVNPETGLLCYIPEKRVRYKPKPDPDRIKLEDKSSLVRVEGIWYRETYTQRMRATWDYKTGHWVDAPYTVTHKKQLNKKELDMYGLKNS